MSDSSLRVHASRGLRFFGAATVASQILTAAQLLVVGKLVPPEDIGAYVLALTLVSIAAPLGDLGLGRMLVYRRSVGVTSRSRVVRVVLVSSSAVGLGIAAFASLIADAVQQPGVERPLRILAVMVPLIALTDVAAAAREVGLNFRRLAAADLVASVTGSGVTVTLVLLGFDLEALVSGVLSTGIIRLALLHSFRSTTAPDDGWNMRSALAFGLPHSAQRMINTAASSLDYVIVGILVVDTDLGLYAFAYLLATTATTRLNSLTGRVMFPILSRAAADPARLRRGFLEMHRLVCAFAIPLGVGLAVASTPLETLFGEEWDGFGPVLALLAVVGITRGIAGTSGPLLLATGETRRGFLWSVGVLAWQIPIIAIGAMSWGIVGAAGAYAFAQLTLLIANYRLLISALLGSILRPYLAAFGPPLGAAFGMATTTLGVLLLLRNSDAVLTLAALVTTGAISYFSILRRIDGSIVGSILALARGRGA